jgi:hypothetical protein
MAQSAAKKEDRMDKTLHLPVKVSKQKLMKTIVSLWLENDHQIRKEDCFIQ